MTLCAYIAPKLKQRGEKVKRNGVLVSFPAMPAIIKNLLLKKKEVLKMVAKRNSKKVENVVVIENVEKESEVVKMENTVAENVVEVAPVADVVEVDENAQVLADLADAEKIDAETLQHADENASAPADENGKKERKPRAKMDVTPLDVAGITEKRAGEIRGYILQALQAENVENAEIFADAYANNVVYGVFTDIINAMEKKFVAYAKNAYSNSDKWLVFANTRDVVINAYAGVTDNIKGLYICTNEKVISLYKNKVFAVTGNAKYCIDNFITDYYFNDFSNIPGQIDELLKNNIDVVLLPARDIHTGDTQLQLINRGYMFKGTEDIPERKYNGIDKVFPALTVFKFVKQ